MLATGVGFASATAFWLVLTVAVIGTLNPSAGDVSVFLPTEQAYLADRVDAPARPRLYALYNVAGAVGAAIGALASALPETLSRSCTGGSRRPSGTASSSTPPSGWPSGSSTGGCRPGM